MYSFKGIKIRLVPEKLVREDRKKFHFPKKQRLIIIIIVEFLLNI